jgi:hypothetical protein
MVAGREPEATIAAPTATGASAGDGLPAPPTILAPPSRRRGNKERPVYAEGGADLLLAAWLKMRGEGEPEEPLSSCPSGRTERSSTSISAARSRPLYRTRRSTRWSRGATGKPG